MLVTYLLRCLYIQFCTHFALYQFLLLTIIDKLDCKAMECCYFFWLFSKHLRHLLSIVKYIKHHKHPSLQLLIQQNINNQSLELISIPISRLYVYTHYISTACLPFVNATHSLQQMPQIHTAIHMQSVVTHQFLGIIIHRHTNFENAERFITWNLINQSKCIIN